MSLAAGTGIGSHQILGSIGAGGMGACGRRAERVCESRRGFRRKGGAPRHYLKKTDLAHSQARR
jgi:hypothetical protein